MQERSIIERVEVLEQRWNYWNGCLAMESQFLQLRSEMHGEFSAIRAEIQGMITTLNSDLRALIDAGNEDTRRYMRVLHEDLVTRISIMGEGGPPSRER